MQQINLYHPIFLKQKKQFSAKAMLQATAVAVAGIFVVFAYSFWQVRTEQADLHRITAQVASAKTRLGEMKKRLVRVVDPALVAQIKDAEQELAANQRLQTLLRSGEFGNQAGYSRYLIALARGRVDGVWLTGFEIQGAGAAASLEGRAVAPDLVPRYLARLAAQPVMNGIAFTSFRLSRPKPAKGGGTAQAGYVEFTASTTTPEKTVQR